MISTIVGRVYVLSPHAFVLEEVGSWIASAGLACERIRLAYSLNPRPPRVTTEPGAVLVLDACYPPLATETLALELLGSCPGAPLIVVAEELGEPFAFPLMRAGAKGFLTYPNARRQLVPALGAVARGGYWVPRVLLTRFLDTLLAAPSPARGMRLSRREQDVLEALLHNLSNKEIASRLCIAERTVKFHVSNLLTKFRVQRRADLILHSFQARSLVPAGLLGGIEDDPSDEAEPM
jgi:DNA-binding NarL/FixJ family response regulator